MKRGRTPLKLPLLGLGLLILSGIFVPLQNVHAQAAPTNVSKLTDPQIASLISSCSGKQGTDVKNLISSLYKSCGPKEVGGFSITCTVYADDVTNFRACDITSTKDGSRTTVDSTYVGLVGTTDAVNVNGNNQVTGTSDSNAGATGDLVGADRLGTESAAEENAKSCGVYNIGQCIVNFMTSIISKIEWIILIVAAGILGLANYLLGWSTYITVFQFGNLVGNSDGLLAAWGVMRDVANIVLLFGFIFLGVSTILNLPSSEYTAKKAIPSLIIFALLLNFSLFAVEGVIDISNAFATSIYEQATGGSGVCESTTGTVDCTFSQGIGGQVMTLSGITSIFDFTNGEKIFGDGGTTTVVVYAGLIVFAVITTLVLAAAAIMLIIRAVVLAFLMVTAPIGFAGMAIPPLHEMAQKWWKELLSQAFFAPIYFLLALVSLKIMSGVITALTPSATVATATTGQNLLGAAAAASATSGGASTASTVSATGQNLAAVFTASVNGGHASNITVVMTFALIIGFMIAALMFAKSSSAHGTSIAMAGAGKLAFGTLGFVGRNTAGRALYRAGEGLKKTNFGRTSRIGMMAVGALSKGGTASFDYRGAKSAGVLTGAVGNLGTTTKGGYGGAVHEREEVQKKYANDLKNTAAEIKRRDEIQKTQLPAAKSTLESAKKAVEEEKTRLQQELKNLNESIEADITAKKKAMTDGTTELSSLQAKTAAKIQGRDAARAAGKDSEADALDAEITASQNYATALQQGIDRDKASITALQAQRDANTANARSRIMVAEATVAPAEKRVAQLELEVKQIQQAPKRQFAEAIHEPTILGKTIGRFTGVKNVGDHHASEAIIRELDKSDTQKLIDALDKANKSAKSGEGDHGPAPATDGGGGHH